MLRLFDPTQQFQDRSGALLVGGSVTVYYDGTDDLAKVYNDNGQLMAQPVPIDSNGRVDGLFVEDDKTYRLEVYKRDGGLLFPVPGMTPGASDANISAAISAAISALDYNDEAVARKFVTKVSQENGLISVERKQAEVADIDGLGNILENVVRVDIAQNFNATKVKNGRDNILAQKDIGGPGAFIDDESVDSSNVWAQIGELDLDSLGIATGKSLASCYSNISLSLEFTVYNTGNTDGAIVERGRFDINVHADPSNGKWNYDAQWTNYDSRVAGTHIIDSMRVSKKMGSGSDIKSLTLHAKVPGPSTFKDNALNVSVLKNYGTTHKNDSMNTVKSFVKPWTLWICAVWQTFTFGTNESPIPIGRYLSGNYDSYVDFPTEHAPQLLILDTPRYTQTDGNNAVKRGDLPVIVYTDGGDGSVAWPIHVTDSAQKFSSINANRSMSVFSGGPSGNIEYLARFSSMRFMTPDIDIDTVGSYLIGEDYIYPMQGQTRSISVFFEVVNAGVEQFYVNASWLRLGYDDPKEFKICATYYDTNGTVATWNGTKVLTNEEERVFVTFYDLMHKLEIDFISTDGERWYHFEYFKNGNRSRMVEY